MNIDDVFEKAKDAVNIAAKKTEEVVNVSKMKLECSKVESEIRDLYQKIGQNIYQMKQDQYENDDLIDSLCEDISDLKEKLEVLNQEIAYIQNVKYCPNCCYKNLRENDFCAKCGTKLYDDVVDFDAEPVSEEPDSEETTTDEETTEE